MKRSIKLYLASALVFFAITACQDDDGGIIETLVGSMEAKVDGADFEANAPAAVISNGNIVITGIKTSNNERIVLTAFGTTAGNYDFSPLNLNGGAVYTIEVDTTTTNYIPLQGNFNISSINSSNNRMSGTFSFTAFSGLTDSVVITDGEFDNINYTNQ